MDVLLTSFFCGALLYHSWTDMRAMLLYDKVTVTLMGVGLLRAWWMGNLWDSFWGAAVLLGIMLLLYFVSRGGMGEGDVKLAPALGVWLGLEQGLLCLFLAFVSGGVIGMFLLLLGKKGRKQPVPFGPFLCASAAVAFFAGQEVLRWYWGWF